jgi:hypothetical protein
VYRHAGCPAGCMPWSPDDPQDESACMPYPARLSGTGAGLGRSVCRVHVARWRSCPSGWEIDGRGIATATGRPAGLWEVTYWPRFFDRNQAITAPTSPSCWRADATAMTGGSAAPRGTAVTDRPIRFTTAVALAAMSNEVASTYGELGQAARLVAFTVDYLRKASLALRRKASPAPARYRCAVVDLSVPASVMQAALPREPLSLVGSAK